MPSGTPTVLHNRLKRRHLQIPQPYIAALLLARTSLMMQHQAQALYNGTYS